MIALLQGLPTISLGPMGTIIMIVLTAVLALISWRQRTWKSTADAAIAEMNVHKSACERLRVTNAELATHVGKLEAQTDLKPLIDAVSSWVIEGRARFEAANSKLDVIHAEQNTALKAMLDEIRAQRATSEDSYRTVTAAFVTHSLEDKEYQLRFITMMDSVERRLSEIAVQVGLVKWQTVPGPLGLPKAEPGS